MPVYHIPHKLDQEGYVDNSLVAGPCAIPVPNLGHFAGEDLTPSEGLTTAEGLKLQIARHYYAEEIEITETPREWDPPLSIGDETFRWRYRACLKDHLLDLSAFYSTVHYLRAWAYAEVKCSQAQKVVLALTTHGPADLWLNDQHLHRQEHFHDQNPQSVRFPATFQEGYNRILIRLEEVAVGECPYAMALQIIGLPSEGVLVVLPTAVAAIARRQILERVINAAYLERYLYAANDQVHVRWPDDLGISAKLDVRFQDPLGWITREAWIEARASESIRLLQGVEAQDGRYEVLILPDPTQYYHGNLRVSKRINLQILTTAYSRMPYGTYEQRCQEALEDGARRQGDLFAEIAGMELGRWSRLETDVIMDAIQGINQRHHDSDIYMLGLLGVTYRYLDDPGFPQDLRDPLERCVIDYTYRSDWPSTNAMCNWPESRQILRHTCEILAGQLYPDRTFTHAGEYGRWHQERGERKAISWFRKRATGGFREWDSNTGFEQDVLALAHLVDLAQNVQVWDLAATVMDKIFLIIALNSYRGAFGSSHGRTDAPSIKSARLEPTSGIARLMWGLGNFNTHLPGIVSLACARRYGPSAVIERLAHHLPEEMWSRERHAGELDQRCDQATGSWEVNKVTYKTPDYMLCSAQDYCPGEKGDQQHIWQATMGPDAVVFATHPPCISEKDSRRPNFWCGNRVLPRVAQWRDALIAIHKLPQDDWLGFTHAYFPLHAFDEHLLQDGWAFARKGDGYLALTASQGLTLITRGQSAYRELRSHGLQDVWLCHMGRAAQDGSFAQFQERVLGLDMALEGLSVRCTTLRGESLALGWEGPLTVDGKEQPIAGFKHFDTPYCTAGWPASHMEVRLDDQALILDFSGSDDAAQGLLGD